MTQQWTPEDSDAQERREARTAKTQQLQTELVRRYLVGCLTDAGYTVTPCGDGGVYAVSALSDEHVQVTMTVVTTS